MPSARPERYFVYLLADYAVLGYSGRQSRDEQPHPDRLKRMAVSVRAGQSGFTARKTLMF